MAGLADDIRRAGVVGAGGAGFPAHIKASSQAEIVIANGAECEPLLQVDRQLMERYPGEVLSGLRSIMQEVGAKNGIIALKKKYANAIAVLSEMLNGDKSIKLKTLDDVYPAGDEHLLVANVTGRAVPEHGIPIDVGVVVHNIQTIVQIQDAAHGKPVTDRFVTVCGAVERPGTFRAPIGTPFSDLIRAAGGITEPAPALIAGGPMMGTCVEEFSDPLLKTISGLIVLSKDHPLIVRKSMPLEKILWINRTVCCQCSYCTQMCPRYLIGHEIQPHLIMRASQHGPLPEHLKFALSCSECGVCTYFACPMGISPGILISALKRKISAPMPRPEIKSPRPLKDMVRVPLQRLTLRLGLGKYDKPAPLSEARLKPARVVLKLKQHTGEPSKPLVREGVRVKEGELLAEVPEGKTGAMLHASISGIVEMVSDEEIVIRSE